MDGIGLPLQANPFFCSVTYTPLNFAWRRIAAKPRQMAVSGHLPLLLYAGIIFSRFSFARMLSQPYRR